MKVNFRKIEVGMRDVRTCPKCSGRFQNYNFMEFLLDRCESCEGIWLNKGELEGILRKAARGPLSNFLQSLLPKIKHE
jgi:Zn-finger nucleic acid-binding protein